MADKDIAIYAKKNHSILVTRDLEFGSLELYPTGTHYGLVIVRLPYSYDKDAIIKSMLNFLKSINTEKLPGKIHVLEVGRYRVRDISK